MSKTSRNCLRKNNSNFVQKFNGLFGIREKKVETLVGHRLPGQVMRAGPRLLKYSMEDVPTAIGA